MRVSLDHHLTRRYSFCIHLQVLVLSINQPPEELKILCPVLSKRCRHNINASVAQSTLSKIGSSTGTAVSCRVHQMITAFSVPTVMSSKSLQLTLTQSAEKCVPLGFCTAWEGQNTAYHSPSFSVAPFLRAGGRLIEKEGPS